MTLAEFAAKYCGQKVDYDKAYGPQCVDMFRQYCADVVGCPHTGSVEGAKDLWFNFSDNDEKVYFDRYSSWFVKPGDVAIWDSTSTKAKQLLVLEQDGFKKDGAKLTVRGYENLLGVLRAKA